MCSFQFFSALDFESSILTAGLHRHSTLLYYNHTALCHAVVTVLCAMCWCHSRILERERHFLTVLCCCVNVCSNYSTVSCSDLVPCAVRSCSAVCCVRCDRCRSRILEQEDARERERHFLKFIKIMKVTTLFLPTLLPTAESCCRL